MPHSKKRWRSYLEDSLIVSYKFFKVYILQVRLCSGAGATLSGTLTKTKKNLLNDRGQGSSTD